MGYSCFEFKSSSNRIRMETNYIFEYSVLLGTIITNKHTPNIYYVYIFMCYVCMIRIWASEISNLKNCSPQVFTKECKALFSRR